MPVNWCVVQRPASRVFGWIGSGNFMESVGRSRRQRERYELDNFNWYIDSEFVMH